MSDTTTTLEEGAPSAKLVYKVLEYADEPMTQRQIADESLLPIRTVRGAIYDLRDAGIIEERTPVQNPNTRTYQINEG